MNLKEFVQQNTLRCVIGAFVLGIIVVAGGMAWTRRWHHRNSAEPVTP